MSLQQRLKNELEPYIVSGPNSQGEYRARCPLHDDTHPSASFNFRENVYHCAAGCGGGTLTGLVRAMRRGPQASSDEDGLDYDPFENVTDINTARSKRKGDYLELKEEDVNRMHKALIEDEELTAEFTDRRGIEYETIVQRKIGWHARTKRFCIPVYDEAGRLVNVRLYKPDAPAKEKMINWRGHGSARLYPIDQLQHDELLVVEGELDALIAIQNGMPAISGTSGAATWMREWGKLFKGKHVYVVYDNDKEGRGGATKVRRNLSSHAASVTVLPAVVETPKGDVTDYFIEGGTAEALWERLRAVRERETELVDTGVQTPIDINVIGSLDATTNSLPLRMSVTVMGKKSETFSVPAKAQVSCTMDAGAKCKVCPMLLDHEGETTIEIHKDNVPWIARFIESGEEKVRDTLRAFVGAPRCTRFEIDVIPDRHTVEELFVTSSIDRDSAEPADLTQRRIYNIGKHDTKTNTVVNVVGTTWPNPKDSRNEFYAWDLKEATTSLDKFQVTPVLVERLKIFRPAPGQTPLDKCREIALDLSANVTHIYGRERLHIAYDLVWHSVLQFVFDGQLMRRGWLEFLVVGETRTGKSETVQHMAEHYRLGHIIGCEGATFAGLVGAVKQVGKEWTITWGEITINDRRLVALDEASGLSQEIISQMSDIRSRGEAQLTKAEHGQTRARCRMIWISNPRKRPGVDEKRTDGIDIIEELIGNPEDIARFDFAMSVKANDVEDGIYNDPSKHPKVLHRYTSDLCHDLVLWSWSRKPSQVIFTEEAVARAYEGAKWLGERYIERPPLVQKAQVRQKIARISAAIAARTFSADETGENLIVRKEHVEDAVRFMHRLYGYDNFGYRRLSKRVFRNQEIAKANRRKIKRWLKEHPRLLEFLMDRRGSFRAQDLEELAFMQRDEVNVVLSKLSDAKMISKEKSQIVLEPELQDLLKEFDV